jgi:hypothetical protein
MIKRALLLALAAAAAACSPKPFRFEPNGPMQASPARKLKVAVAPFEDLTPDSTLRVGDMGYYGPCIFYVPFWTKGVQDAVGPAAPDPVHASICSGSARQYYPALCAEDPERVEQWLARDLAASGLFESVEFRPWHEISGRESEVDLVVSGRFLGDERKGRSYCVMSPLFIFVQMIPLLPGGSLERTVAFDVEAVDPREPAMPVWSRSVRVKDKKAGSFKTFDLGGQRKLRKSTPAVYRAGFEEVRQGLAQALAAGGALDAWYAKSH